MCVHTQVTEKEIKEKYPDDNVRDIFHTDYVM